tara:strand:+ start:20596 stop:20994 length:399 start_codon:yes stop_codon:yes gene_type:complete
MLKLKGYISSRVFVGERVPQNIQNLCIRDFCSKNKFHYILSSTEHAMENSFLVLKKLSTELNNLEGIVMYSMFQLPTQKKLRMEIFKNFKKRNKKIFFALENKEYNSETKNLIEEIWDIKNVIMQKQYQFQI